MTLEQPMKYVPPDRLALTSPAEPLPPEPLGRLKEATQARHVPVDSEVVEVTPHALDEPGVLLLDRIVPMASAVLGDGRDRPSEPRHSSSQAPSPRTALRPTPVVRETQEVERGRPLAAGLPASRPAEGQDAGLLGMEAQPIPGGTRWKHRHDPSGVLLALEAHDQVIGVTHEEGLPAKPRPDVALEPFIEHMVQVDVSKQRRQDRALRRPLLRLAVLLPVENSHVQALSDQSQERRVAHPLPKHLQEHLADDAVGVALDVSLQNPAHARRPPVEGTEGLVCAASRPEAVRVGRENRLV